MRTYATPAIVQSAHEARRAGISCIPILADGTKRPAVRWKAYQQRLPTWEEIEHWFAPSRTVGIAFLTGAVSGGLEVCDFDTHGIYAAWATRMRTAGLAPLLTKLEHGYREQTPHGIHLLYRCCQVEGNQKLARQSVESLVRIQSLIETRGEGGYGIVAPSGGRVHPSGRPYRLLAGSIETIPVLSFQERASLFTVARSLDSAPPVFLARPSSPLVGGWACEHSGSRPGDWLNQQIAWEALLPRYGWELVRFVGAVGQWRRPGKQGPGISATTNYADLDLLYVFSTATALEPGRGYTKFTVYTLLEHGGDFAAAARAIAGQRDNAVSSAGFSLLPPGLSPAVAVPRSALFSEKSPALCSSISKRAEDRDRTVEACLAESIPQ